MSFLVVCFPFFKESLSAGRSYWSMSKETTETKETIIIHRSKMELQQWQKKNTSKLLKPVFEAKPNLEIDVNHRHDLIKQGRKKADGQSNSYIENKIRTPWLKK